MKQKQRVRQVIPNPQELPDLAAQVAKGWKLVALEWEREIETPAADLPADIPYGLRVSDDALTLEENPEEREILFALMELIVQEGSYARIADEVNRRGFRTRDGSPWTPVSVFEMLPRLIEVGPHVFHSEAWQKRRTQISAIPT